LKDKKIKISCSARKDWQYHISDWIDFEKTHAKIHSGLEFDYEDIDYVFGNTEDTAPLWGGRMVDVINLTKVDIYWLYGKGIGYKATLSSRSMSDADYKNTKEMLKIYHREGNAIITAVDKLAGRIKNDFPKYKIEASAVMDITTKEHLNKVIDTGLYDTIVLPMCANDDTKFLESINNKDQIRLFINAECSYTCPKKVCYGTLSQINKEKTDKMICSHYDLKMPRTFYDDSIDWNNFYFDKDKFDKMGFSNYKLLPSWEAQQRTHIMYRESSETLGEY
jgi:hypothetical protein